ncbi:MAG: AMP-binding protein [Rhizobiales bacterium]|nr:AMP-binding protein [Hyphomicrobiales bacterium]
MALRNYTFGDVYRRNAECFPDRTAFIFEGKRVTHLDYLQRVERLAGGLARLGVTPGDRVAILSQNSLEMVDLIGAVALLGAILLPVNYRLSPEEIGFVLADGAPVVVVAGDGYHDAVVALKGSLPSARHYFGVGAAHPGLLPFSQVSESGGDLPHAPFDADAGFVIIHTAAVGGRARGALLSQAGLLTAQSSVVQAWQLDERDVSLGVLPLFHVAGLGLMLTVQQAGGASVIAAKFDAGQAARDIAAEKITVMSEFAPMLGSILDQAQPGQLSSLRVVTGLDAPATIERFESEYPDARFWATFGQSETSGLATLSPYRDRPKSAGRPLFWRSMAVVDGDDRPKAAGQVGEIVMRGPAVFKGYWNLQADTAITFRNGWHHTGDMGHFDADGYLWYGGRMPEKELIKTGGENVYPAEVENAIRQHPSIADVVVIGVPDPQWGEAIKAICVLHPSRTTSADEIIDFAGGLIARYKRPKIVVFVDKLPKTTGGDIDRPAVKAAHGQA